MARFSELLELPDCQWNEEKLVMVVETSIEAGRPERGEVFDIMCMKDTWNAAGTINRELYILFRMTQCFVPLRTNLCGRPSL